MPGEELEQRVEHPGAVVAGVATVVPAAGDRAAAGVTRRAVRGHRCSQGHQRGREVGGVLAAAASVDRRTAGTVVPDRQTAVEMGGAFLAVELPFVPARLPVRVDDLDEVAGGLAQVGRVQCLGLGQESLDPTGPDLGVTRQVVDGPSDDLSLRGGEPAVAQRLADRGQDRFVDRPRQAHDAGSGALVPTGHRGDEVLGRGPADRLDGPGGLELSDDRQLDGIRGRLQRLELGHGVHQLVPGARSPQGRGHLPEHDPHLLESSRNRTSTWGARRTVRVGGHRAIQASTTDRSDPRFPLCTGDSGLCRHS